MTDTPIPPNPDDEPTVEELAAASSIRPLDGLPSNWTVKGNPSHPGFLTPSISALSPNDQTIVRQRAGSADPEAVQKALLGFLQEKRAEARVLTGAGEGATEAERTALEQMGTMRQLSREAERIEAELADVVEYRNEIIDGQPTPVPVYRYNREGRTAREARLNEIKHEMALVAGIEGERDLERAVRSDVMRTRELNRQFAERAEAKALGEKMLRDERVKAQAETYAKHRRHTLN